MKGRGGAAGQLATKTRGRLQERGEKRKRPGLALKLGRKGRKEKRFIRNHFLFFIALKLSQIQMKFEFNSTKLNLH
jgi:hypothetical protein